MPLLSGVSRLAVSGTGVVLTYGDRVALDASDFEVPAHGLTVLIGPNGSGKSTVLAAIAGLHRPSAGSLTVLGDGSRAVRARVALVPQSTKVNDALPVTVREVVTMGRYASLGMVRPMGEPDRSAVHAALARLDLEELSGRHLRELSGGQRQRVFVAQGLVQPRDLLLMDEPTTALDLGSSQAIHEVVAEERAAGRPVVVTTHDFAEARLADHVLLLANRVVAQGPPQSVFTAENLASAYGFDVGDLADHVHVDDAAHRPARPRHTHIEPRRPGG